MKLSSVFADMLQEVGQTIRIAGSLNMRHTDARAIAPITLVHAFAEVRVVNFKDSIIDGEQADDAFLLGCMQVRLVRHVSRRHAYYCPYRSVLLPTPYRTGAVRLRFLDIRT